MKSNNPDQQQKPLKQERPTDLAEDRGGSRSVFVDGRRFREIRLRLDLTQEKVASSVGYSDRLVRKLERGGPVSRRTLADFNQFYQALRKKSLDASSDLHNTIEPLCLSNSERLERLTRQWFERAFNDRDLRVIDELIHPDVTLLAEGRIHVGREAIRRRVESVLAGFTPLFLEIERIITQDQTVIAYWVVNKTHSGTFLDIEPTGRDVTIHGSSLATFEDDRIIEVRDHWDVHDLLRQLA